MATIHPLNPFALHDPAVSLSKNIFWKRVWGVALATSVAAFVSLGVLAVSLTSTLWPAHLPIVTIMVLAGGLPSSSGVVRGLWKKVNFYQEEASYDQKIKREMELIPTKELSKKLRNIGFSSRADIAVQKNLLARYNVLETETRNLQKWAEMGDEVELWIEGKRHTVRPIDFQISKVDFQNPGQVALFEALQRKHLTGQKLLQMAALTRLKAAYTLRLIQMPSDQREPGDYIIQTAKDPLSHIIAKEAKDPSAQVIAKVAHFKGGDLPHRYAHYTCEQLLSTSAVRLSSKDFGLRLNWF